MNMISAHLGHLPEMGSAEMVQDARVCQRKGKVTAILEVVRFIRKCEDSKIFIKVGV